MGKRGESNRAKLHTEAHKILSLHRSSGEKKYQTTCLGVEENTIDPEEVETWESIRVFERHVPVKAAKEQDRRGCEQEIVELDAALGIELLSAESIHDDVPFHHSMRARGAEVIAVGHLLRENSEDKPGVICKTVQSQTFPTRSFIDVSTRTPARAPDIC